MKKFLMILMTAATMFSVYGCRGEQEKDEKSIKIAFVCKDLEHYWFQQEKSGMEKKCQELNLVLQCFDSDYDDEKCMKQVQKAAEEFDGLIICTTSQELGEEIGKLAEKKGIAVVTIDDSMADHNGKAMPFVGMAFREVGAIGGRALAKMAQKQGFLKQNSRVHILEVDVKNVSTFRERLIGYEEALFQSLGLGEEDVEIIESDTGMYQENREKVEEWLAGRDLSPEDCWIICGANDDCALAPMHVLKERGVPQERIIACGLGGYDLSMEEFKLENRNYITVMTQPDVEGAQAVQMLYEYILQGKEMDSEVVLGGAVATCDNYLIYFANSGADLSE